MRKFNNPLDNIHIASPCNANWEEMFGNERKRHCGECRLNVYNLSDMTRRAAENLLVNSEGRLCVRFFRRADGTVLTKNCPIGWQAVKRRVSRVATAAFSMIAGLITGMVGFRLMPGQAQTTGVVTQPGESVTMGGIGVSPIQGGFSPVNVTNADEYPSGLYERGKVVVGQPLSIVKALEPKPMSKSN